MTTVSPLLSWILSAVLLLAWGVVLWQIWRREGLSLRQKRVKTGLNTLLFLLLVVFLFSPARPFEKEEQSLLVYDASIPREARDSVRSHYGIQEEITAREFKKKQYGATRFFFLGQDVDPAALSYLAGKEVHWLPFGETLEEIRWEGILRKDERQTVEGRIRLTQPGVLKLVYGEYTLDSLLLSAGEQPFRLAFPVFAEGRNRVTLQLEDRPLRDIAFYARARPLLFIAVLPDHPDFESRILTEWLGGLGHYVEISTPVARSVVYESRVNRGERKEEPDLVIATPGRAQDPRVKRAVAENRSVFFFGLDEVPDALTKINRATGSRFSARRVSEQENRPLPHELTALPYTFIPQPNQRQAGAWPVSFQKNGATVAVSLMNETFPVRLRGDTLMYNEIWGGVLSALETSDTTKVRVPAPVFRDMPASVTLHTARNLLPIEDDTLFLKASPVNPLKKTGKFIFPRAGWHSLPGVGEVWVEDAPVIPGIQWENWLKANGIYSKGEVFPFDREISATLWFWLFLLFLTALWAETKFTY